MKPRFAAVAPPYLALDIVAGRRFAVTALTLAALCRSFALDALHALGSRAAERGGESSRSPGCWSGTSSRLPSMEHDPTSVLPE
jgi:hypothetical protein